ncbi:MAG: hypothetical protein AB1758_01180 [Candidatus Eremiobacterota bacterium]
MRAFTLAEALISLVLVALVLGIVAAMMGEYASIGRFSSGRDQAALAVQVALERMAGETREAAAVLKPDAANLSSELLLERLDPSYEGLPAPVPDPPPPSWNPYPAAARIQVRYRLASGTLVREVTPASGPTRSMAVAESLGGLACRLLASGNVEISVSVQVKDRILKRTAEVLVPAP